MNESLRIIGGTYRGKKIHFPAIQTLRPTSSRVRETLFNWLMFDIRGARCLDVFSGSGALGFEAFSRGAKRVVLLEKHPLVVESLKRQLREFNSLKLSVHQADALHYLKTTTEEFDVIFLDPPFDSSYLSESIEILTHSNILANQGLLYVESSHDPKLSSADWTLLKSKKAGQVVYGLYQKLTEIKK